VLSPICPCSACCHPSHKHLPIYSLQETSVAGARRGRPPCFVNELEALYGGPNWNTSCFMSAGGIGAAMPPHVMRPQDDLGPSSYHSGSKRDTRDHVVNSPEKKSCNAGEYMARLSESIAARSTTRVQNVPMSRRRSTKQCKSYETMVC